MKSRPPFIAYHARNPRHRKRDMKITTFIMFAWALTLAARLTAGDVVIRDGDSIAFLGDSITHQGSDFKPNGYVNLVIEGLKVAGVNARPIPAGVGGNTTVDMLARLDRDVISKKPGVDDPELRHQRFP